MKLAVIGNPGFIDRSYLLPTANVYARCGNNTGNLVFWYAFQTHITASTKKYFGFHFNPDQVNQCDAAVILFANHVNPQMDLGPMLQRLDDIKIPVTALGLGVQGELDKTIEKLPAGSIEYFKLLSEKSEMIGLRGTDTQSALARIGVENTQVLGCVSNFITPKLEQHFRGAKHKKANRILLNNDLTNAGRPVNELVAAAFPDATFETLVQAPLDSLHVARNEFDKVDKDYWARLNDVFAPFISAGHSMSTLLGSTKCFFDTRPWLEYSRGFDFSIGTRMHGNMVSLQSGTPTLFCVHDARTKELCATMSLPTLPDHVSAKSVDPEILLALANEALDPYLETRSRLLVGYKAFLQNSKLPLSPLLNSI